MPQIQYTVKIDAPVERVWAFVEHLPNWAPLMIGYQKMEEVTDRRSVWTLRGDVGILAREVDLQADITVWDPLRRVEFTLTGLTEKLTGAGTFTLAPDTDDNGESTAPAPTPARKRGRLRDAFARLQERLLRKMMKRADGAAEAVRVAAASVAPADGAVHTGEGSLLTFDLSLEPGGPMAPMLDLLMAPMLKPAVMDLTSGIRAALEGE